MSPLDDPEAVRAEYASEGRLLARSSIYAASKGEDPNDMLVERLRALRPARTLEVGCGPGTLARRLREEAGITVQCLDISERMVELVSSAGIEARVGDVQALPFDDRTFDCVVAAWMLYHVPDLERGLAEITRVLTPRGCLLAVTNSARHLEELWQLASVPRPPISFSAENGESVLRRHLGRVGRCDVQGIVTFADRAAVCRYLAASPQVAGRDAASRIPALTGPFCATRRNAVFSATR